MGKEREEWMHNLSQGVKASRLLTSFGKSVVTFLSIALVQTLNGRGMHLLRCRPAFHDLSADYLAFSLLASIVTLKPRTNPIDLTRIFRKVANRVLDEGGNVRGVVNHGIRILPYRFHSKHSVSESENRWFGSGRWISAYYDSHPAVAKEVETFLWQEDRVLRVSTVRPSIKMDKIRSTHLKSNPWDIELRAREARLATRAAQ